VKGRRVMAMDIVLTITDPDTGRAQAWSAKTGTDTPEMLIRAVAKVAGYAANAQMEAGDRILLGALAYQTEREGK